MGPKFIQSHYSTIPAPPVTYGEFVEEIEDIRGYRYGHYHPVHIDDRLKERYRVVHKLGSGTFSTVWLAVDEKTTKHVAIKVGTTDASRSEIDIVSQMTQSPAMENLRADQKLFPTILDRFEIIGPNGTHLCLVTPPARCNLRESQDAGSFGLFQLDVARSFAAQLVIALSIVHERGFAHGDLHLGNIFLQMPSSLDSLSVEQLYARYGEPKKEPVVYLNPEEVSAHPSIPSYVVHAAWLGIPSDHVNLGEAKLILSDFGVAFRPDEKSQFDSHAIPVMRPPESQFEPEVPLTFASDIYSLGCAIFELVAHRTLLDGYFIVDENYITAQQIGLEGPMPSTWWRRWKGRSTYFDEEGNPLSKVSYHTWERRFGEWVQDSRQKWGMGTFAEDEMSALIKLLRCMLVWMPSDRPDISKVLQSEWMTKWALPAFQKGLQEDVPMTQSHVRTRVCSN
ncbi:hypothetical protein E4U56_003912 [Claviceps arundinis]|uniref:non-specific serine/threonine protein kinase n=1 Tax=Claviceps arundinis TaxID=1623583 RepID=A0A9P7SMV2_9HYPO|nr:hypothetical protein E4U56_003912 [Claviceps arundinis]